MYITIQGDTWDAIAFKVYGDERHMAELIKANPDHATTVVFSAGVVLNSPVISSSIALTLPPWKRGVAT